MSDDLKTKVQELIDSMINPAVAGHGGFVELVDVQDNRVYLQMGGCGAAALRTSRSSKASSDGPKRSQDRRSLRRRPTRRGNYYTPGKA
jgi:hypothetical protein